MTKSSKHVRKLGDNNWACNYCSKKGIGKSAIHKHINTVHMVQEASSTGQLADVSRQDDSNGGHRSRTLNRRNKRCQVTEDFPGTGQDLPGLDMTVEEALQMLSQPDGVFKVAQKAVAQAKQIYPAIPRLNNSYKNSPPEKKVSFAGESCVRVAAGVKAQWSQQRQSYAAKTSAAYNRWLAKWHSKRCKKAHSNWAKAHSDWAELPEDERVEKGQTKVVSIQPDDFKLSVVQGRDYDLDNRTHVRVCHAEKRISFSNRTRYYQYSELASVVYAHKRSNVYMARLERARDARENALREKNKRLREQNHKLIEAVHRLNAMPLNGPNTIAAALARERQCPQAPRTGPVEHNNNDDQERSEIIYIDADEGKPIVPIGKVTYTSLGFGAALFDSSDE